MTPKEKANELWAKMLGGYEGNELTIEIDKLIAKQDALICVDEIISIPSVQAAYAQGYSNSKSTESYWREVKQEIKKL